MSVFPKIVGAAICFIAGYGLATYVNQAEKEITDLKNSKIAEEIPGYMVVMGKGYQREQLGPYAAALPPIYAKYGGHYIAIESAAEEMEGDFPYQSIIISKWPNTNAARNFWTSPEYAEARKLREGIGEFDVVVVNGFAAPKKRPPLADE